MARKYTDSKLLYFIKLYLKGNSHKTLVEKYNLKISYSLFIDYIKKYQLHGKEVIKYQKNNRRYTKEFEPKDLEDNRGRGKPMELQSEEERLNVELIHCLSRVSKCINNGPMEGFLEH